MGYSAASLSQEHHGCTTSQVPATWPAVPSDWALTWEGMCVLGTRYLGCGDMEGAASRRESQAAAFRRGGALLVVGSGSLERQHCDGY